MSNGERRRQQPPVSDDDEKASHGGNTRQSHGHQLKRGLRHTSVDETPSVSRETRPARIHFTMVTYIEAFERRWRQEIGDVKEDGRYKHICVRTCRGSTGPNRQDSSQNVNVTQNCPLNTAINVNLQFSRPILSCLTHIDVKLVTYLGSPLGIG